MNYDDEDINNDAGDTNEENEFKQMFESYLHQKRILQEAFETARELQNLLYNEFYVKKNKHIIIPRKFKYIDNMPLCLFKTEKIIEGLFYTILN